MVTRIIEKYIRLAEPISSKFLEKCGFFGLSSATIRSEMNGLEELGYLAHLHTSGGRVPTDRGYRYYVDNHVNPRNTEETENAKLKPIEKARIRMVLVGSGYKPRSINKAIGNVLSDLSENVVITNVGEEDEFFKTGLANLFEMPEFREFDRIFRMTSFFDEFEKTFAELERAFFHHGNTEGNRKTRTWTKELFSNDHGNTELKQNSKQKNDVKIFIGRENPIKNMRDGTVMFAKYNLPQGYTGSLTLVGPTRMDYAKNIGLIKYATNELNKISRTA